MVSQEKSLVRSLQRGLQIINVVAGEGPLHAKRIARVVTLPLPTAYHLLRTLVHDGYLVRLDDGTYVLGDRFRVELSEIQGGRRSECVPGRG
ncbi:helix-turn-helix domain-containing protein [Mycolicibacterium palauense]|uniref:helix-turn-helix domain-containing protein n=1 Tax=Mycolicibacterium palauense TaxID=2034511 RepID=UPI002481E70C|nr:helix-turn-helix domain-containing protein [Mycolicibacterium palauense]